MMSTAEIAADKSTAGDARSVQTLDQFGCAVTQGKCLSSVSETANSTATADPLAVRIPSIRKAIIVRVTGYEETEFVTKLPEFERGHGMNVGEEAQDGGQKHPADDIILAPPVQCSDKAPYRAQQCCGSAMPTAVINGSKWHQREALQ